MGRISKDPHVRMTEILDATEKFFYSQGYHETQISDIVKSIGVAQGTFYYYFKSKEEVLEALINRQLSRFLSKLEKLVSDKSISHVVKLQRYVETVLQTIEYEDGLLFEFLIDDQHIHLMDKLTRQGKQVISPFLLQIIEEGQREKVFHVIDSKIAETFVGSILKCLIDVKYEKISTAAFEQHVKMAATLIEKTVGLPENTLHISV